MLRPDHASWRLQGLDPDTFVVADLADATAVQQAVKSTRPEWIFHLAAHGAYPSQQSWSEMLASNVTGTVNLVRAGLEAGIESFVNTGSYSEYG